MLIAHRLLSISMKTEILFLSRKVFNVSFFLTSFVVVNCKTIEFEQQTDTDTEHTVAQSTKENKKERQVCSS